MAGLVFLGGWLVRRVRPGGNYFIFYLLAVAALLLIITAASYWIPTSIGPPLGHRLVFVNGPVILSVVALLAIHFRQRWSPPGAVKLGMLFLIGIAILALSSQVSEDVYSLLTGMLVFVLLTWLIPRLGSGYLVLLSLACLADLFIVNLINSLTITVGSLWSSLYFAMLPLRVVVPAALIHRAVRPQVEADQRLSTGVRTAFLALAVLLLGYFAYTVYWASIWDQTSDGLGGVFFLLYGSIASAAAGYVLVCILPGRHSLAGAAFAVLVPTLLYLAFHRGWEVSYHQLTEDRAAKIEVALERYYADQGRYPQELEALSPRYLLRVPDPVVLRTVGWCYRAGEDHFRLGTFHRKYFSLPISFRLYAQAGDPPDEWACEEMRDYVMDRFGSGWVLPEGGEEGYHSPTSQPLQINQPSLGRLPLP